MSDNAQLNKLLELSEHGCKDYSEIIYEQADYSTLYNFSCHRGSIMQWYPFESGASVLELCAECGAVTDGIVNKDIKITSITDSEIKAQIIKNRFADSLNVIVGNWETELSDLDEKYDYVIYVGKALSVDSLIKIKSVLKDSGKLLIATQNRNGVRLFGGRYDEYTKDIYSAVEGYPSAEKASYDMPEWKKALNKAGFDSFKFRYPYPDYNFCEAIYSDECLPENNQLFKNNMNFEKSRIRTFDETAAFNTAISYGIFPLFSNSYFIEVGAQSNIIFTKFSKERNAEHRVYTSIEKTNNEKNVAKHPATASAKEHIEKMLLYKQKLEETYSAPEFHVSECKLTDGYAEFEFINGTTLSSMIDSHIESGDFEALKQDIDILNKVSGAIQSDEDFVADDNFKSVFKNIELPAGLKKSSYALVDLIGENIIINDKINLIDYEWVLPFAVPVEYIKFRTLALNNGISRLSEEKKAEVYNWAGVDYSLYGKFLAMEYAFQDYVADEKVKLQTILDRIDNPSFDIRKADFSALCYQTKLKDDKGRILACANNYSPYAEIAAKIPSDCKYITLEAAQGEVFMNEPEIFAYRDKEKITVKDYSCNASRKGQNNLCFFETPVFEITNEGYDSISIKYSVYLHNSNLVDLISASYEKDDVINSLNQRIQELAAENQEQAQKFKEHIESNIVNKAAIKKMLGKSGK